jgi:hypothetical protein
MKALITTKKAPYKGVMARSSRKFSVFEFDEEKEKVENESMRFVE